MAEVPVLYKIKDREVRQREKIREATYKGRGLFVELLTFERLGDSGVDRNAAKVLDNNASCRLRI